MSKETKDLVAQPNSVNFPVLLNNVEDTLEALRENLGDQALSPFDLERVTIPLGGNTTWTLSTLDGDVDQKEIVGVIVAVQSARAFWRVEFSESGGGTPPDCSSDDGKIGNGDPGGSCLSCPYNEFGSKTQGKRGKACKEIKRVFLLLPERNLPTVINLPPGSLKEFNKYLLRLADAGLAYYKVATSFTLIQDKNADGIKFSKAMASRAANLTKELAEGAKAYAHIITDSVKKTTPQDFAGVKREA